MAQLVSPGPQHKQFTAWAKSCGVQILGLQSAKIPGRGLGICAQRKIEAGEELVIAPSSTLFSINSVPKAFREKHKGITVHGLLASFLAFGGRETKIYDAWRASWPSLQDFEDSMPLLWPGVVREPLTSRTDAVDVSFPIPPTIGGRWAHSQLQDFSKSRATSHLLRQEIKLHADWTIVSEIFPDAKLQDYTYYWCIVNSRSFYWEFSGEENPKNHDDRMVLVPFVDYFNHNDHGCNVSFDAKGFVVTTDRAYEVGEELFTSYGHHNNDFLLVEYGFILETNKWDYLPLDDFFSGSKISETKKEQLKRSGYWGNYTLTSEGVCYRTQVAVRLQTMNLARWKQFVSGKEINSEDVETKADSYIVMNILKVYYEEAEKAIRFLEEIGDVIPAGVRVTLISRWKQVQTMVRQAFRTGIKKSIQAQTHEIFDLPPQQ